MTYAIDFATIRAKLGSPTITCVRPRSGWTSVVPAGYAYDAVYDRYVDSGGVVWDETSVTLPTDTVNIIPLEGETISSLIASGIMIVGDRAAYILPADYTTVNNASWYVLDSITYNKVSLTPFPASVPLWYTLQLRKR